MRACSSGYRERLRTASAALLLGAVVLAAPTTYAGQTAPGIDGPPPPVPPAGISRDPTTGRATLRAFRLTDPLRIDGRLDEAVYTEVLPISDFIQMEPHAGSPAT